MQNRPNMAPFGDPFAQDQGGVPAGFPAAAGTPAAAPGFPAAAGFPTAPAQAPAQAAPPVAAPAPAPAAPPPGPEALMPPAEGADVIEVDLSEVTSDFRLPAGRYPAYCVGCVLGNSQKGDRMITWEFAIAGGEHQGKTLKTFTVLTAKAMWKVAEVVSALGLGTVGEKVALRPADALNRPAYITLADDEYMGQMRSTITKVESATA